MFPMLQERSILFQKLNNYNTQPGHSSNTINTPFINIFSHLLIESSYAAHFLFVQQHSCAILTKKKKKQPHKMLSAWYSLYELCHQVKYRRRSSLAQPQGQTCMPAPLAPMPALLMGDILLLPALFQLTHTSQIFLIHARSHASESCLPLPSICNAKSRYYCTANAGLSLLALTRVPREDLCWKQP